MKSFVRSSKNVAEGLTKLMTQALLRNVIGTGEIDLQPEQWIIQSSEVT